MKLNKKILPGGVDQRKFRRMPTLFSGTVSDGRRHVEVVVLDVSVNGAKIRVEGAADFGDTIKLNVDRLGDFTAEVMWRRENRLGLRFTATPEDIARRLPEALASRLSEGPDNADENSDVNSDVNSGGPDQETDDEIEKKRARAR